MADHYAMDDEHALNIARNIAENFVYPGNPGLEVFEPELPLYDPGEIYGVIPSDTRRQYDVREVIARIVDGSRFQEFKENYGETLVCGRLKAPISSSFAPTAAFRCYSCRTSTGAW